MKLNRRDTTILVVFMAVVVVGCGAMIWLKTKPPTVTDTKPIVRSRESDIEYANRIYDESRIYAITGSGIFTPLVTEPTAPAGGEAFAGIPVETRSVIEVTPEPQSESSPEAAPMPSMGPEMMPAPVGVPAAIDVAVTGVVIGGKTMRALIYDNRSGTSQWTDVPGKAFNYDVRYVTLRGAVLEKDGRTYVLLLGANKKATKRSDYAVPGAAPAPAMPKMPDMSKFQAPGMGGPGMGPPQWGQWGGGRSGRWGGQGMMGPPGGFGGPGMMGPGPGRTRSR